MTKREGAIVAAYTGVLIGDFSDMHEYVEEIMGRPVFTHEMGNEKTFKEIKKKSKHDFINIEINGEL
jgi:hypothetical protein